MAILNTNPAAEVSVAFETIKPGTYPMRITEVTDRNPDKNDIKIKLEYVDKSGLVTLAGEQAKNPGSLFDYVQLASDKQWKLRTLYEAAGLGWPTTIDPCVDLQQVEVPVTIKLEEYEGEQKNKVARYVIKK